MTLDEAAKAVSHYDFGVGPLFRRVRDAVIVANARTGRILLWNPAAETMFGYSAAEARGLTVDELVPPHLRDRHRVGLARYGATGHGTIIDGAAVEVPALRKDGQEIVVELQLSSLDAAPDEERLVLAVIRDVTERARADARRAERAREHARLVEQSHRLQVTAAELASMRDTPALLQGIVDRTMAALGADGCAVWLFDEAQQPRLNATRGLSDEFHRKLALYHGRQIAAGTEAARSGQPSFVRDVAAAVSADDPEFGATLVAEGLVSGLRLPLRGQGGQVAGWLTLYHRRERLYSDEEVQLAQTFTDQIAVALHNARLTEQERTAREEAARRLERVAALARITEQLIGASDPETALRVVAEAAARLCSARGAVVALLDGSGTRLMLAATYGGWDAWFEAFHETVIDDAYLAETPTGQALTSGRPVLLADYAARPIVRDVQARSVAAGVRAAIVAPLRRGSEPLGVLWIANDEPGALTAEDAALAQALADQAALALEQARLARRSQDAAVLEERARLARDLHDSVTQSIFSLGMLARAAQTQHTRGAPALGTTLGRIGRLAQEALAEMRALLFELRPGDLDAEGLAGALDKLVASFRARADLAITYEAASGARLAPDTETAIFRIVQEALGNAVKHARATAVAVSLAETDGRLTATVTDNGAGFDPEAPPAPADARQGGMGLRSMRERAQLAGLVLQIVSTPGAGTTVSVSASLMTPAARR